MIKNLPEALLDHPLRNEGPVTSPTIWLSNAYITAATSENTRKAYRSDVLHYERSGGKLPATPETIIAYLKAYAPSLNPRTLARRLTALKNWHIYQGFLDPTAHPAVSKTLAGITRIHGCPKEKAYPLLPEDLLKIVLFLETEETLASWRDSALLQIGFFGAFRRSELVAIRYENLKWEKEGIEILIPQSKTDQDHEGHYCAIPYGTDPLCPVTALTHWLTQSGIIQGPIFRRIFLNGKLEEVALAAVSVNNILEKRAKQCNLSYADQLSSHSLRRGLATSASRDGASLPAIMRQGRWKQVNTVMEYIEAAQRFEENAATSVLKKIQQD
jgi:integrase